MSCEIPYRDDSSQRLLYKIASCCFGGGAGVTSFNGRQGVVTLTSGDVSGVADDIYVNESGDSMTGALSIDNGSQVASTPYLSLSQTWNNAATTFTGLLSNVTNTASNTDSNLFNFQSDGIDRFRFAVGGQLYAVRQDASNSGMTFFLRKRGNAGSATGAVANDSTIGTVAYSGWDGAAFATGSRISGLASEAWTGAAHGSRLDFYVTPVGSIAEQLTFRITSAGPNVFSGLAYQYNSVNVIQAQTTLSNFFFANSGNLTMTGTSNLSFGSMALSSNTTGGANIALGVGSLNSNTTGSNNVGVGVSSLFVNTIGIGNMAIGTLALSGLISGNNNVGIGVNVATGLTTGSSNVFIGQSTGAGITTGNFNTILGANVSGLAAGLTQNIIIADGLGNQRINVDSSGNTSLAGNLSLATAKTLSMASGANTRTGNVTLVAGTVTVANTSVTANTIVLLTRKTAGGTLGTAITYTVIPATSFTINSDSAIDTSTFSYLLIENP